MRDQRPRAALPLSGMVGGLSSALLLLLALPPFNLFPLSFLALVPLAVSLASVPAGPGGPWQATLLGLLFGVTFWGLALVWLPLVVGSVFSWAVPGYLLLLVILGGLSSLFGWGTHFLSRERNLPFPLALALAWVAVEFVKAHFPFGLAFPWLGLSLTLSEWPELLSLAEWTGEAGVSFWLAGVNGLVACGVLGLNSRRSLTPWLWAAGLALLPSALGIARARTLPLADGPAVLVVGTHIPRELRENRPAATRAALAQVQEALRGIAPGEAGVVVLPEATVSVPLGEPGARSALETLANLASELKAPVVVGALGGSGSEEGEGGLTNSAFLFLPGKPGMERYDKVRLVPGMEAGSYRRGSGGGTMEAGDWLLGPLLCYESLFGGLARKTRGAGADLLVNLSSDIWFGHEDSLLGALFLHQHPAHLRLRAVENRMPVARSANGGFSLLLDPLGRLLSEPVPPRGGVTRARVPIFLGTTFYSRIGDWMGTGCAVVFIVLLFGAPRREGWLPFRSHDKDRLSG